MINIRAKTRERELTRIEEDTLIDFQFAVIDALNEQGISKTEFADLLGVSKARVSQMLSSNANPTIKAVARVCQLLNLHLSIKTQSDNVGKEHKFKSDAPAIGSREGSGWSGAAKVIQASGSAWASNDNYCEFFDGEELMLESA
jgi:transcriptional regulator with XRE-family HTH domain